MKAVKANDADKDGEDNKEEPSAPSGGGASLGSIYDIDLAKNIIMMDNGFNEDDFPKAVKDEAAKAKARFHVELEKFKSGQDEKYNKKHQRQEQRNLFCFSIDNKSTRAIDDAISIQKVHAQPAELAAEETQSRFWKIGIHIADLNEFVSPNKALDKEAE